MSIPRVVPRVPATPIPPHTSCCGAAMDRGILFSCAECTSTLVPPSLPAWTGCVWATTTNSRAHVPSLYVRFVLSILPLKRTFSSQSIGRRKEGRPIHGSWTSVASSTTCASKAVHHERIQGVQGASIEANHAHEGTREETDEETQRILRRKGDAPRKRSRRRRWSTKHEELTVGWPRTCSCFSSAIRRWESRACCFDSPITSSKVKENEWRVE